MDFVMFKLARYGVADPGSMTQDEWRTRGGRKDATWLKQAP
jgi:hypothetical protein